MYGYCWGVEWRKSTLPASSMDQPPCRPWSPWVWAIAAGDTGDGARQPRRTTTREIQRVKEEGSLSPGRVDVFHLSMPERFVARRPDREQVRSEMTRNETT